MLLVSYNLINSVPPVFCLPFCLLTAGASRTNTNRKLQITSSSRRYVPQHNVSLLGPNPSSSAKGPSSNLVVLSGFPQCFCGYMAFWLSGFLTARIWYIVIMVFFGGSVAIMVSLITVSPSYRRGFTLTLSMHHRARELCYRLPTPANRKPGSETC